MSLFLMWLILESLRIWGSTPIRSQVRNSAPYDGYCDPSNSGHNLEFRDAWFSKYIPELLPCSTVSEAIALDIIIWFAYKICQLDFSSSFLKIYTKSLGSPPIKCLVKYLTIAEPMCGFCS